MLKTRITEMLGIEYPIVQGGMQHLGVPELAAAVSNAGGLGTINITIYPTPAEFKDAVVKTKSLTDKPFCVNISLLPDLTKGDAIKEYIKVCVDEGVKVIETAGTSPEMFVPMIKEGGIKLIHKVPAVKYAITAEKIGADAVTIVGFECGGHPGKDEVGTIVLANKCARSVKIPVLVGGGIADGRGMAAALALGGEGIVMGTRFVACKECWIHDNFKNWIVNHNENDTILCQKTINNMVRVANNGTAKECLELEKQGVTFDTLIKTISGARGKNAYISGNTDGGMFAAGNCVGLINDVLSAKEIIDNTVAEYKEAVARLNSIIG